MPHATKTVQPATPLPSKQLRGHLIRKKHGHNLFSPGSILSSCSCRSSTTDAAGLCGCLTKSVHTNFTNSGINLQPFRICKGWTGYKALDPSQQWIVSDDEIINTQGCQGLQLSTAIFTTDQRHLFHKYKFQSLVWSDEICFATFLWLLFIVGRCRINDCDI